MNIEEWAQNEVIVSLPGTLYTPPDTALNHQRTPGRGLSSVWTQQWSVERPKRHPRPTVVAFDPVKLLEDAFDPILIALVRRAMPNLLAHDICGVQPMVGPTGLIFAMRTEYDTNKQRRKERYKYDDKDDFSSCF
jgi:hypothetical protein